VVVGGDFNVVAGATQLDGMFARSYARGTGRFYEADVPSNRVPAAASATEGGKKIDYVFHDESVTVLESRAVQATSDHKLLLNKIVSRGTARQ